MYSAKSDVKTDTSITIVWRLTYIVFDAHFSHFFVELNFFLWIKYSFFRQIARRFTVNWQFLFCSLITEKLKLRKNWLVWVKLSQAAAVSNEKLAGPIDGVGQCFSEKKVVILIVVF